MTFSPSIHLSDRLLDKCDSRASRYASSSEVVGVSRGRDWGCSCIVSDLTPTFA
jgi:hypothetical protein